MGGVFRKYPFSIVQLAQHIKIYLLEMLLTRKQKRILFLTRVYINARKRQVQNVMDLLKDDALYESVDNVSDKSVFDLPFRLYKSMWSDDPSLDPHCIEDEKAFEKECNAIFERVPEWMLYGRKSDRMEDIRKLYRRVNHLSTC